MARMPSKPAARRDPAQDAAARAGQQAFRLRIFAETIGELRRVTWPSREQTTRLTMLVIATSATVGALLGAIDWVFSWVASVVLF